ncbi:MAG TPA: secondary thiamine-phosphate synthase enzyme YjbQ [Thermoplasmata archaeon]|nr:secondary thiamine-phosphate synthase enzyme YjbQ [Thermoplasmata archaeon]
MVAFSASLSVSTRKGPQATDITREVTAAVVKSRIRSGLACIFTPSSTSAILTNEFEPGLMEEDIPAALERLFPEELEYGHEKRWGDGNGHSHVRATFLGPSLTIPVVDGALALGRWQQVVLLELDNKPRRREVLVQIVGES